MNVPALLLKLNGRGIQVWADGERLRCNAPAGELTCELQTELLQHKQDILAFLRSAEALGRRQRAIVPLQPKGGLPPVFGIGGHNGDVFCYRALVRHLGAERPFYGLQPPGVDGQAEPLDRVENLAAYFCKQIRAFHGNQRCVLAGYCAGGGIAFELALQLQRAGTPVEYVALFGAPYVSRYGRLRMMQEYLDNEFKRWSGHARRFASLPPSEWPGHIARKKRDRAARLAAEAPDVDDAVLALRRRVERATVAAMRSYSPGRFAGRMGVFVPCRDWIHDYDEPLRWRAHADIGDEHFGPDDCERSSMLLEPHAAAFAALFAAQLARVQPGQPSLQ